MIITPFSANTLEEAINILRNGGVIAHATETCYGLACDLSNIDAVRKLFAIKQRPAHQPVSALFQSIDQATQYVIWNDEAQKLADQYLPGPLTIILPMQEDAPTQVWPSPDSYSLQPTHYNLTVGVRLSSSPVAQSLVTAFGSPVSTTSANVHGQPNPYSAEDIAAQFGTLEMQPDLVLDSGTLPPTPPSTVIDLTAGGKTLRGGSISPGK